MSEVEHTPGPWRVIATQHYTILERTNENRSACSLYIKDTSAEVVNLAADLVLAANCHADLLAALEFYTSICGNTCGVVTRQTAMEMYANARAAIAKAKGETA